MKLHTSWDGEYVVLGEEDFKSGGSSDLEWQVFGTIYVAPLESASSYVARLCNERADLESARYLDHFHVVTPVRNSERRQEIYNEFFKMIAEQYESLIDVDRNTRNIRNLALILDMAMNPLAGRVVDFGCGTGLSAAVLAGYGLELVGVDPCSTMRMIASRRGMQTWSVGELARQPSRSVDAAFASYVFHLLPHAGSLRLLWSRLRPGGYLAANFHKGRGVDLVEAAVHVKGSSVLPPNGTDDCHGSYYAFRKPK